MSASAKASASAKGHGSGLGAAWSPKSKREIAIRDPGGKYLTKTRQEKLLALREREIANETLAKVVEER